jgi:hypothetical protein
MPEISQALPTRHRVQNQTPKAPKQKEKKVNKQQERWKNNNHIGLLPICNKLGGLAWPPEPPRFGV